MRVAGRSSPTRRAPRGRRARRPTAGWLEARHVVLAVEAPAAARRLLAPARPGLGGAGARRPRRRRSRAAFALRRPLYRGPLDPPERGAGPERRAARRPGVPDDERHPARARRRARTSCWRRSVTHRAADARPTACRGRRPTWWPAGRRGYRLGRGAPSRSDVHEHPFAQFRPLPGVRADLPGAAHGGREPDAGRRPDHATPRSRARCRAASRAAQIVDALMP